MVARQRFALILLACAGAFGVSAPAVAAPFPFKKNNADPPLLSAAEAFTPGMFLYMRLLSDKEGLTQSDISDRLDIRGPTAIKVIDTLEQRGLIYREKDLEDRRRTLIYLTNKGRKLRRSLMKLAIEVQDIALTDVSDKDYRVYLKVVAKMHDALRKDQSM